MSAFPVSELPFGRAPGSAVTDMVVGLLPPVRPAVSVAVVGVAFAYTFGSSGGRSWMPSSTR